MDGYNINTGTVEKEEDYYDMIELPSLGKLYSNNLKSVKLYGVTAPDENILTSSELMKSGTMIKVLLTQKIDGLDGLTIDDLLSGDRNALTIALRKDAYGNIYKKKVITPSGNVETFNIDLDQLKLKYLQVNPDENGQFDLNLPKCNKNIKFRLLNQKDEDYIQTRSVETKSKDGIVPYLTTRLERMICSVDGDSDRINIARFVRKLPAKDSLYFREYVDLIEPGYDMDYEFVSKNGEVFTAPVIIDFDFFYPNIKL